MDPESNKFGRGPRELTGAVDLISHYKLLPHHEFFCKKSLPFSISDTHYLHNMAGDTEIRKGEGMQLDQLIQSTSYSRHINTHVQPFDLDILQEVFHLRETGPIDLPGSEKGIPTIAGKSKSESKDNEKKHKKQKDMNKENDREHKKHKHRSKDQSKKEKHKENKKDKSGHHDSGADHLKKHHEKKRKHGADEDLNDVHRYGHHPVFHLVTFMVSILLCSIRAQRLMKWVQLRLLTEMEGKLFLLSPSDFIV